MISANDITSYNMQDCTLQVLSGVRKVSMWPLTETDLVCYAALPAGSNKAMLGSSLLFKYQVKLIILLSFFNLIASYNILIFFLNIIDLCKLIFFFFFYFFFFDRIIRTSYSDVGFAIRSVGDSPLSEGRCHRRGPTAGLPGSRSRSRAARLPAITRRPRHPPGVFPSPKGPKNLVQNRNSTHDQSELANFLICLATF